MVKATRKLEESEGKSGRDEEGGKVRGCINSLAMSVEIHMGCFMIVHGLK